MSIIENHSVKKNYIAKKNIFLGNPNQKEYPSHHGSRQNFDSKSQNGGTIPILGNKLNRPPPTMPTSSSSASSGKNIFILFFP